MKKDGKITDSLTEYFLAIHEISKSGRDATTSTLEQYMDLTKNSIYSFFQRNLFIEKYVDIKIGSPGWNGHPTTYTLNEGGKNAVSLIYHFSDYFSSI